jgi:hypothetical protein
MDRPSGSGQWVAGKFATMHTEEVPMEEEDYDPTLQVGMLRKRVVSFLFCNKKYLPL